MILLDLSLQCRSVPRCVHEDTIEATVFCRIQYPFLRRKACTHQNANLFPLPFFLAKMEKLYRVATLSTLKLYIKEG